MPSRRDPNSLGDCTHNECRKISCLFCPTDKIRILRPELRSTPEQRRRVDLNAQLRTAVKALLPCYFVEDLRYPLSICLSCSRRIEANVEKLRSVAAATKKRASRENEVTIASGDSATCACYICTNVKRTYSTSEKFILAKPNKRKRKTRSKQACARKKARLRRYLEFCDPHRSEVSDR